RLAGRSARRLRATLSARSLLRYRILLNHGLYLQSKVVMMGEAGSARKPGVVSRETFEGLDVVQFRRDADRGGRLAREVVAALSELDSGVEVGERAARNAVVLENDLAVTRRLGHLDGTRNVVIQNHGTKVVSHLVGDLLG